MWKMTVTNYVGLQSRKQAYPQQIATLDIREISSCIYVYMCDNVGPTTYVLLRSYTCKDDVGVSAVCVYY